MDPKAGPGRRPLDVPRARAARPDTQRLEERYAASSRRLTAPAGRLFRDRVDRLSTGGNFRRGPGDACGEQCWHAEVTQPPKVTQVAQPAAAGRRTRSWPPWPPPTTPRRAAMPRAP